MIRQDASTNAQNPCMCRCKCTICAMAGEAWHSARLGSQADRQCRLKDIEREDARYAQCEEKPLARMSNAEDCMIPVAVFSFLLRLWCRKIPPLPNLHNSFSKEHHFLSHFLDPQIL